MRISDWSSDVCSSDLRCETPFMVYDSKSEEKMSSTTQREVIEVGIEELISRTDAILPAIAERGQQTERDRRLPEATIQDIRAAGLNRVMQPVRWGGYGLDFEDRKSTRLNSSH